MYGLTYVYLIQTIFFKKKSLNLTHFMSDCQAVEFFLTNVSKIEKKYINDCEVCTDYMSTWQQLAAALLPVVALKYIFELSFLLKILSESYRVQFAM